MTEQSKAMGENSSLELGGFAMRHIGPDAGDISTMLEALGYESCADLMAASMPEEIRTASRGSSRPLDESEALQSLWKIAQRNQALRSCIGMGYHDVVLPPIILRSILENPCWYTQYTPYQSEISQGRLEALLNYQTMVSDLTGLPVANASLLDEATAAAEAMLMCRQIAGNRGDRFLVSDQCHPQTLSVLQGRAGPLEIKLDVCDLAAGSIDFSGVFGVLVQSPDTRGLIRDWKPLATAAKEAGAVPVMAADPLSLMLVTPPGEMGFDIAIGSTQRFGVPMGFGGPHAAYMATREAHVRRMPGRIIGVSRDSTGAPALRMAIQTREQHIKRDRATSNICTAQVLLAIMASMYAVWHGPIGLRRIAERVRSRTDALSRSLSAVGVQLEPGERFDTVVVVAESEEAADAMVARALDAGFNIRRFLGEPAIGVTFDETTSESDVAALVQAIRPDAQVAVGTSAIEPNLQRQSGCLLDEVFNQYRSETEMLRYITRLQARDLSLAHSMIPLGSCTMKLNATAEMLPVSWRTIGGLHPFAPRSQWPGYEEMFSQLEVQLAQLTGFDAVSLQPNAGSQGEYAGLLVIRAWHRSRGDDERNICLIPMSAHGTNPASAVVAGFEVVPVLCNESDISLEDLAEKIEKYRDRLGAIMITYPSTHGVFEGTIKQICEMVHQAGGQVYLDGANLNAMLGHSKPGEIGADVCHLNLHKTFCIPHGGGGPGMGPIAVASHLAPFLPGHPVVPCGGDPEHAIDPVSAAPWGSASILPISWMYIAMMGDSGLTTASDVAVLSANYMAKRLESHYAVLYRNEAGCCAHEFIIDLRPFDKSAGVKPDDVAKRLMDYGFHAPTMSWPVPGTLMIEPTESESLQEIDRYCEALISIREEIREIESGHADREDNVLKNAPHSLAMVTSDDWSHPYSRSKAAWPIDWLRERKFWPPVGRVDNPWGDRNLACTCAGMDAIRDA
ncbi:MAG: aminomethyl-transferring glycine dehydrogenase [Phycisphaerales bacterium]|nr:aminomethyl-transferring glycine dehydrogenase [Phycisphaerales bacterium]